MRVKISTTITTKALSLREVLDKVLFFSSYLFILCEEAFLELIKHLALNKDLAGLKCTKDCPSMTDLLFIDDSLVFCRANIVDYRKHKTILDSYEKRFGQQINF